MLTFQHCIFTVAMFLLAHKLNSDNDWTLGRVGGGVEDIKFQGY